MRRGAAPARGANDAQQHAQQQAANLATFLQYARTRPIQIPGTIPTGSSGGTPASNANFSTDIPVIPAWAAYLVLEVTLPLTVTTAASQTTGISPYFPWSSLAMQLSLAGSPPWDLVSLVPWWIDYLTSFKYMDFADLGPGGQTNQLDPGPFVQNNGGFTPGATIVAGGSPVTTNGTVTFRCVCRLQRRRKFLFGAIPLGDPENRPKLTVQLSPLVGPNPEVSPFQSLSAGAATVASLSGQATVNAIFLARNLDIFPPGIDAVPTPTVGMGLALNYTTTNIGNPGQLVKMYKTSAMIYEKMLALVFNSTAAGFGGTALRPDYFGKWLTGEQQSARYEYDATQGTFASYYEKLKRVYDRYFPVGCMIDDMVSGEHPEFPEASPYRAFMTPDTGYAQAFGIPATPAMTLAVRTPAGTPLNAAYAAQYDFGLVNVPY